MSTADTIRGLRLIAQALEGLPVLPDSYVTIEGRAIVVSFGDHYRDGATERVRRDAVDVLLTILGGPPPRISTGVGRDHYGAIGALGEYHVDVTTPVRAQVPA